MAKATLPMGLPGSFFVLHCERTEKRYKLIVHDSDLSSYDLGTDALKIVRQFDLWGYKDLGLRALDQAREFGVAQAIFSDGRVVNVLSTLPFNKSNLDPFEDETDAPPRHNPFKRTYPSV